MTYPLPGLGRHYFVVPHHSEQAASEYHELLPESRAEGGRQEVAPLAPLRIASCPTRHYPPGFFFVESRTFMGIWAQTATGEVIGNGML